MSMPSSRLHVLSPAPSPAGQQTQTRGARRGEDAAQHERGRGCAAPRRGGNNTLLLDGRQRRHGAASPGPSARPGSPRFETLQATKNVVCL